MVRCTNLPHSTIPCHKVFKLDEYPCKVKLASFLVPSDKFTMHLILQCDMFCRKMVRTYKRKSDRASYGAAALEQAIELVVEKKASLREASQATGVPFNTIRRKLMTGCSSGYSKPRQVIPSEMEEELASYLLGCSRMNYGLTTKETRQLAYGFASANSIEMPGAWKREECAGKDWLPRSFCSGKPTSPSENQKLQV